MIRVYHDIALFIAVTLFWRKRKFVVNKIHSGYFQRSHQTLFRPGLAKAEFLIEFLGGYLHRGCGQHDFCHQ